METRRKEVVARRASEAETKREMLSPSLSLVDAFPQASHWSSSSHLVTQRGERWTTELRAHSSSHYALD